MVGRSEPSDIFESIGLDALGLLERLDEKLFSLTGGEGRPKSEFMRWLSLMRPLSSAIAFHGGEILADSASPLGAFVVGKGGDEMFQLRFMLQNLRMDFLDVRLICWDDVCRSALEADGALLRSYFSSELLFMFGSKRFAEEWGAHAAMTKLVFEEHPLEDLSWMIAKDVKIGLIKDPLDFDEIDISSGKKVMKKTVPNTEFVSVAKNAMKMRRVCGEVHQPLMDQTRKRLSNGLQR
jgi:hypothetical protein